MTLKTNHFPVRAYSDNIIVERLEIKNIPQKRAEKSRISIMPGAPPKNLLDIEKQKAAQLAEYENAEDKLLTTWDEQPNQGIVKSVGPGRDLGNGVLLVPKVIPGQHIYIRGHAGDPIIVNKRIYWVIKDHEIIGDVPAAELIK